jgi:hypothetical protein
MTRMIRICSAAFAILFASSPTLAQTDAENIRARVKDGQKVSITDDQGQEFKGRIGTMAADGLSMLVDGKSVDLAYDRIVRIDRPNDSLANGALIGFGVGAALGLTAIAAEAHRDCDPLAWFGCSEPGAGGYIAGTLLLGGLGTAAGVGIDALIHRDREIYRRGAGAHATVAPALGRGALGACVLVTW